MLIGCDTGGTFTDFVCFDPQDPGSGLVQLKLSSTPEDPSRAVLEGLRRLCPAGELEELTHGTTVATNTLLERTGGCVALLTTRGFGDNLWLGRGDRNQLYSLRPGRAAPPLPREFVFEIDQRHNAAGEEVEPLNPDQVRAVLEALPREVEAVAVCYLHAPLAPEHELLTGQLARELGLNVFLSHEISPTSGEYERALTCVLAASLAPRVGRYLNNIEEGVPQGSRLWIIHSAGGRLTAPEARRQPHRLALSGPAAGLRGALALARFCRQEPRLVTLDMGGTSTDVALCDGELPYCWETAVEGYPLRAPSLEIHTIGAGGGSLAYLDGGGLLRVGPRSAGAQPGPACYGRGGEQATVTDALCWAGYLPPHLGHEELPLDREASGKALADLAEQMGVEVDRVASGILELSVAHLARAVRKVSTGRGQDPGGFTLLPFGGAGPLLACAVAEQLGMSRLLIPYWAGTQSAWGALWAPWEREWSATVAVEHRQNPRAIEELGSQLRRQARRESEFLDQPPSLELLVTRRYQGQGEGLTAPPEADFHRLHEERFGFCRPNCGVESVQVRVRATGPDLPLGGNQAPALPDWQKVGRTEVSGQEGRLEVVQYRGALAEGDVQAGPFVLFGATSTLWVGKRWLARGLKSGNLVLERADG